MRFLRYLFLFLAAFVAALFTYGNWTRVGINLWSGLVADVNLPFLLLVTFLAGFMPMWIYHLTARWRLRQRLQTTERTVEALRVSLPASEPVVVPAAADVAALP
ncbi:lipopolysaccharide assembly protein LapA domain-containing protein [Sphingomonas sp.]|uniref:lipopolysaccharide assembly protein LapA domain-containing protein n=1 Tax=Sphingomonas sp. TaxID=28214 RepID=UPI003CC52298